jgi:tetratricopeptide (TPR) repeat protein
MVHIAVAAVLAFSVSMQTAQTSHISRADEQRALEHYREGWGLIAAESWAEAAKEFQAAVDIDSRFKLAYYGLGRAHMGEKLFPPAIAAYERCSDLYRSQAGDNMKNAVDADRMVKDDVQMFDSAIQRLAQSQQSGAVLLQIRQLQMAKQRSQLRLKGTDELSLVTPVPAFVSLALGSAYFRSAHMAEAEKAYKAALDVDPKSGEAHSNLAVVYLETGRLRDADHEIREAEKSGFKVNSALKDDIRKKSGG